MKIGVIGTGLYGLMTARFLKDYGHDVVVIGRDAGVDRAQGIPDSMASVVNQARVHLGYHYPRSLSTAFESSRNFDEFCEVFSSALIQDHESNYAIAARGSRINASSYKNFCERAGIALKNATFDRSLLRERSIEDLWLTDERAIDTLVMMRVVANLTDDLEIINDAVVEINQGSQLDKWSITTKRHGEIESLDRIFNCTYANLNSVENMINAERQLTPLRFQMCEVAQFYDTEDVFEKRGLTIMDGAFFSFMPFDQNGAYSLTSVAYTPHGTYEQHEDIEAVPRESKRHWFIQEMKSIVIPEIVESLDWKPSLFVTKTLPAFSKLDDNRGVICNEVADGIYSILGGKLDAVFEMRNQIRRLNLG